MQLGCDNSSKVLSGAAIFEEFGKKVRSLLQKRNNLLSSKKTFSEFVLFNAFSLHLALAGYLLQGTIGSVFAIVRTVPSASTGI